jgi:hypothetical protein
VKHWRDIVLAVLLLLPMLTLAQNGKGDRVEALRVAFINKHVRLTEQEAGRFWPVYNEYHDKLKLIKRELRQVYRRYHEQAGEEVLRDLYQAEQQSRRAELDVHTAYSEKIRGIIGYQKYLRLRVAEENFRRELLKTIREGAGQDD